MSHYMHLTPSRRRNRRDQATWKDWLLWLALVGLMAVASPVLRQWASWGWG